MFDTSWDWWFGDGPLRASLSRLYRRWQIARGLGGLLVLGASCWSLSVGADDGHRFGPSVPMHPIAFTMLEQDADTGDAVEAAADGESVDADATRRERLRDLLKRNDEPAGSSDEDQARRQRLRDLLGDNDDAADADAAGSKTRDDDTTDDDKNGQFAEPFIKDALPEVTGGILRLPPLRAVSIDKSQIGNGVLPDDFVADQQLRQMPLAEDGYGRGMPFGSTVLPWAAPNTFSHPLYFEDRMLERHGHERWGCMQPIAAGARFFTTIPMLPYLATLQEPCDTVYSKGYFRAGSPAPCLYQRPPYEKRAAIVEAASIATGMIALP